VQELHLGRVGEELRQLVDLAVLAGQRIDPGQRREVVGELAAPRRRAATAPQPG
jgi:hypothetical protein